MLIVKQNFQAYGIWNPHWKNENQIKKRTTIIFSFYTNQMIAAWLFLSSSLLWFRSHNTKCSAKGNVCFVNLMLATQRLCLSVTGCTSVCVYLIISRGRNPEWATASWWCQAEMWPSIISLLLPAFSVNVSHILSFPSLHSHSMSHRVLLCPSYL